jgi:hypothetical protein
VPATVPRTTSSVPQISVAHDIIAIKNTASLVTAQFHGRAFRNAGSDHVAEAVRRKSRGMLPGQPAAARGDALLLRELVEQLTRQRAHTPV